jgi:hypothetical protein
VATSSISAAMATEVVGILVQFIATMKSQGQASASRFVTTLSATTFQGAFVDHPKEILVLIPDESSRLIVRN